MFIRTLLAVFTLFIAFDLFAQQLVEFKGAYVRKPIPGMSKTAGYGVVINNSNEKVTFVEVKSNLANKVEFHDMTMENGMMRMRKLDQIVLQPTESVSFQSGGKHIMFFGVKPLEQGATLELIEDNGKTHKFDVEFKEIKRSVHNAHH